MTSVAIRPRSPTLSPFIESLCYHEGEIPFALERVLPAGRMHLMVNLHGDAIRTYGNPAFGPADQTIGAILEGPQSKPRIIDTSVQRCFVAADFRLGGAAPFFRMPLGEVSDQLVGLDQLWRRDGALLRERLLEAATPESKLRIIESVLLRNLLQPRVPDPAIAFAASSFQRGATVSAVAAELGLLGKTFTRRFRDQVGLSPKRFSRVLRFQRVLRSIRNSQEVNWSALATEHGYSDQAHFVHDFRDLSGMTPTAYRPRSADEQNHVPLAATAR